MVETGSPGPASPKLKFKAQQIFWRASMHSLDTPIQTLMVIIIDPMVAAITAT